MCDVCTPGSERRGEREGISSKEWREKLGDTTHNVLTQEAGRQAHRHTVELVST